MRVVLLFFTTIFFLSCQTSYQKKSFSGGYEDSQLDKDVYKVSFHGNGYTKQSIVKDYAMRRCAELTIEQGFDHFVIIDKDSETTSYESNRKHSGTLTQNASGGYSYNGTSRSTTVEKHTNEMIIKMFKNGLQPQTALNAQSILKNYKD